MSTPQPLESKTTKLYLADTLLSRHPKIAKQLRECCQLAGISAFSIPMTRDIWAVDYMPLQRPDGKFVRFKYNPDYLKSARWQKTISDVDSICQILQIDTIKTDICLDGGNVVRAANKMLLCDKVFIDNKSMTRKEVLDSIKELLCIDKIIVLPRDPADKIGHADGMVRFINDDTVLVNDYSRESKKFQQAIRKSLDNAGLNIVEFPYEPYLNQTSWDATGVYINYLQMSGLIVVPVFDFPSDNNAVSIAQSCFPDSVVCAINSTEIAKFGGSLNCVTWNICE